MAQSREWRTVARFTDPVPAQLALGALREAGLLAEFDDEFTANMDWGLTNALGGVKLQVPLAHEAQARDILDEMEATRTKTAPAQRDLEPLPCPHCGHVGLNRSPFAGRWFFGLWLVWILIPIVGSFLFNEYLIGFETFVAMMVLFGVVAAGTLLWVYRQIDYRRRAYHCESCARPSYPYADNGPESAGEPVGPAE